ncbi:MAG: hypothetical protein ACRCU2_25085 [Planktothrix sp.]
MPSILTDCSRIVLVKSLKHRVRVKETGFLAASLFLDKDLTKKPGFTRRGDGVEWG